MKGQTLPIILVMLALIVLLFQQVFNISLLNHRKIKKQKELDAMAFNLAVDQARALNGIAALNQALIIAKRRGYLMAAAVTGLTACTFLNPQCAAALKRLLPKVKPFYKKLNRLGESLAKDQEELIAWAYRSQDQAHRYFKVKYPKVRFTFLTHSGNNYQLPIARASTKQSPLDLMKCHESKVNSWAELTTLLAVSFGGETSAKINYQEPHTGIIQSITHGSKKRSHPKPFYSWPIGHKMQVFNFKNAHVRQCTTFAQSIQYSGSAVLFEVPEPYVLKSTFFKKNTIIVSSHDQATGIQSSSTSQVAGSDLNLMHFTAKLVGSANMEKDL